MDKVEEFINQKTLKAMSSSQRPQAKVEEKRRKEPWWTNDEQKPLRKKLNDYEFTLLNTEISKFVMEIKKDPEYQRPPKTLGNTRTKNQDRYYKFYEVGGH